MMGRVFFAIFAIFLLLGVFRENIQDGIKGWRTNDTTEAHSVVTGAGVTTANVTLTDELFQDSTAEVIAITSNITGENPVATSYVSATQVMLVSALNPSATHTLTVNYYAETESTVVRIIGPFLSFLIFGFLLFCIIGAVFKFGRGRRKFG